MTIHPLRSCETAAADTDAAFAILPALATVAGGAAQSINVHDQIVAFHVCTGRRRSSLALRRS
jgi:hypothetical protein